MEEGKTLGRVKLWRASTVVPAKPNPSKPMHTLNDRDLAMKAHYIRAVYYFDKCSVQNFCNGRWKEGFFESLMEYSPVAGRLELGPDGREFIRCNDAGVRIVEAFADAQLVDWKDLKDCSLETELSLSQIEGTQMEILPLVAIQITRFKCGGVAIGLSWSHVLGGAFCASLFMRSWSECCRRSSSSRVCLPGCDHEKISELLKGQSNSKQILRDFIINMQKGETLVELASFRLSNEMVDYLISSAKMSKHSKPVKPFVAVSAFVWRSILKAQSRKAVHRALICRETKENNDPNIPFFHLGNDQILAQVELCDEDMELSSTWSLCKIAESIQTADPMISVDKDEATLVYGYDLTFVNWEQLPWFDLVFEEEGPIHVSCTAEPVGINGMVMVMPSSPSEGANARLVKVSLSRDEVVKLKQDFSFLLTN
ncbi:hypothetical protein SUGI_0903970 [Cryptomeria japonica]|uniref:protein ECERIFERUM 2 n=1 Tax=Cryptomeria japonica TaxID=3369 RepID=UPI002414A52E|nr:protein ECERIFERUM 2 [Cryptomeria japonica]GLJ43477.1 hypothetical protein SUGI_0903970 [Cryptomeria japonica]